MKKPIADANVGNEVCKNETCFPFVEKILVTGYITLYRFCCDAPFICVMLLNKGIQSLTAKTSEQTTEGAEAFSPSNSGGTPNNFFVGAKRYGFACHY
jgi:hypothetical protein